MKKKKKKKKKKKIKDYLGTNISGVASLGTLDELTTNSIRALVPTSLRCVAKRFVGDREHACFTYLRQDPAGIPWTRGTLAVRSYPGQVTEHQRISSVNGYRVAGLSADDDLETHCAPPEWRLEHDDWRAFLFRWQRWPKPGA